LSRLEREARTRNALLVILGVGGAALWIALVMKARGPAPREEAQPGFDVKEVPDAPRDDAPVALAQPVSSLTPPKGEPLRPAAAAPAALPAYQHAPGHVDDSSVAQADTAQSVKSLNDAVRRGLPMIAALAKRSAAQSPSLRKFAQEWKASPDLGALNARYKRDGDMAAYLHGLAASPTLPRLLKEHAGDPALLGLATDVVMQAPGLVGQALAYAFGDPSLKPFAQRAMNDAALPPALTATALSAAGAPQAR
jgi:hypothetical protein